MPADQRSLSWSRRDLAVLPIALLGVGVQALSLARGLIPWNSDQGIVALMGRHIALGIAHPIFCYGSYYGGTLEPHVTSLVFSALGMNRFTYRLSLMLFLAALLGLVYAIGRRFLGRSEALLACAYLALPPFFYLLKGLTSDGAYVSLAVLGGAITYGALRADEALERERPARAAFALLGVSAGLAWWVHPVSAYFFIAVTVWFLMVRPTVFLRFRDYPAFFLSFLLGSLPWWVANLQSGWLSLKTRELTALPADLIARQFFQFFFKAVPVLLGGRSFYAAHQPFPGASMVALLIYVMVLILTAARVARTGVRTGKPANPARRESRTLLLLLILVLSMQFLVSFSQRTFESDPRFLFPIYVPFSLLVGYWIVRVGRAWGGAVSVAAALGILAFHAVGFARTEPQELSWQPTTGSIAPVIRALDERGLREVYTGYWTAYRLAFESGERIRPGIFGVEATDRYPAYTLEVDRSKSPAVVLWGGEASRLTEYLARVGSRAKSTRAGPHVIFWGFEPAVLEELRRARGVPP